MILPIAIRKPLDQLTSRRVVKVLRLLWFSACFFVAAIVLITALTLGRASPVNTLLPIPNVVGFYYHAVAGSILNYLGTSPEDAAIQWYKAASHARTKGRIAEAAQGIVRARSQINETSTAYFDTTICAQVHHGSPITIAAVEQSGIRCSASVLYRNHVPEGTPIFYDSRPPIGGPHYDQWYPHYGVVEKPILPGYWVHNLEHGAIVLLYNCPGGCPDLVAQIQALYPQLQVGQNANPGSPRLLALPYTDMDHRLAVVAWDHLLELDTFDKDQIVRFFDRFLDRGPECVNLRCPR